MHSLIFFPVQPLNLSPSLLRSHPCNDGTSQLGSASSETVTSIAQPGTPGDAHSLPSCTDRELRSKTAAWFRHSCQGWGLASTFAQFVPLLPACWEVLDLAAVVHHSTSEGKTGLILISNPPQSRSVLNPSKTNHFAI